MNLDLLKKLTRLANHNPNDNEANLAARKVCKILEEGNWSLNSYSPPLQGKSPVQPKPATTYGDVKRSTEPGFKSTPPNSAGPNWDYTNFDSYFGGIFGGFRSGKTDSQYNYQTARQAEQERIRKKQAEWDMGYAARQDAKKKAEERRKQPKRPLDCCRCKKSFMTGFQGPIENFKCHNCYWEEYREKR